MGRMTLRERMQADGKPTGRTVEVPTDGDGYPAIDAMRAAAECIGDGVAVGPSGLVMIGVVNGRLTVWR